MEPHSPGNAELEEIVLPKQFLEVEPAEEFTRERHRWNTNEEIASILLAFDKHSTWQENEVKVRPPNGSMLLYSRKHVRYRQDGYCWKKRKDGRTTREDHMKLKVRGVECIYGCYVHSAILPTFHRRCYWLLQNRDIVLVHFLNVPSSEDGKECLPSLIHSPEKKTWMSDELLSQIRPMYTCPTDRKFPLQFEPMTEEVMVAVVNHLVETQHQKTQSKTYECPCKTSAGTSSSECIHTKCRIISPKGSHTGVSPSIVQNKLKELIQNGGLKLEQNRIQGNNVQQTPSKSAALVLNLAQMHNANGLIILSGQNSAPISIVNSDGSIFKPASTNNAAVLCMQPKDCDKTSVIDTDSSCIMSNNMMVNSQDSDDQNNLHLSADEIQQTLAANMPQSMTKHEPDLSAPQNESIITNMSPQNTEFNLDAFDILDLPDFDINLNSNENAQTDKMAVTGSSLSTCSVQTVTVNTGMLPQMKLESQQGIANITEFCPEWAYTKGGDKILIIGPWYSTTSPYTCLFDGVCVPAILIQNGVLRCYAPAHGAGIVSLQVTCEGRVISSACTFEYRETADEKNIVQPWLIAEDHHLQVMLLQRLQQVEKRLEGSTQSSLIQLYGDNSETYEHKLVDYCELMIPRIWVHLDNLTRVDSYKGMTLLHYATTLGYKKLVNTFIKWRRENPSIILEYEINALSLDDNSSTPLLWSCAKGHIDVALMLCDWDCLAINVCDKDGFTPAMVARNNGYYILAEKLQQMEKNGNNLIPLSPGLLTTNSDQLRLPISQESFVSMETKDSPTFCIPMTSASNISNFSCPSSDAQSSMSNDLPNLHIDIPPPSSFLNNSKQLININSGKSQRKKRTRLTKQFSLGPALEGGSSAKFESLAEMKNLRSANSDSHLNLLDEFNIPSKGDFNLTSQTSMESLSHMMSHNIGNNQYFVMDDLPRFTTTSSHKMPVAMETDDMLARCESPYVDVETISDEDSEPDPSDKKMVNLATRIIAAMPERIKLSPSRSDDYDIPCTRDRSSSRSSFSPYCSSAHTPPQAYAEDSGICTPMGDTTAFDEARYPDVGTPTSCPGSPCLASPYSFTLDSPPPTKEDFREYFNAPTMFMERDFSLLTLSDQEQRNLFEAAKIIQNAYRQYKTKLQDKTDMEKEVKAAVLIQSYYRRYKQYEYQKIMSEAAVTIQSQFRTYYAQKRFKKSRDAAMIIQNQYRTYKEHERFKRSRNAAVIIQQRFRTHYQRKRNQEKRSKASSMQKGNASSVLASQANEVSGSNASAKDTSPK